MASQTRLLLGNARTSLTFARGVLALCGSDVDRAAASAEADVPLEWRERRRLRDGDHFHITFLTKDDLRVAAAFIRDASEGGTLHWPDQVALPDVDDPDSIAQAAVALVASHATGLDFAAVGAGRAVGASPGEEAAFLVLLWPAGAAARRWLGLGAQDFHVTLGFASQDVHCRGKGLESLRGRPVVQGAVDLASLARRLLSANVSEDVRTLADAAALAAEANGDLAAEAAVLEVRCLLAGLEAQADRSQVEDVLRYSEKLLLLDGESEVGSRSRAFGLVLAKRYGEALPALARARELLAGIEDPIERATVEGRLRKCVDLCRKKVSATSAESDVAGHETFGLSQEDMEFEHAFLVAKKLKFPSTSHLKNLGAATKDDKICDVTRRNQFCGSGRIVIAEEKIDGANLGISLDSLYRPRLQGRSKWVNWETDTQFSGLEQWLNDHMVALCSLLERNRHVLFGEWCQCLHTVPYKRLPGLFVAFDIYDTRVDRFLSRQAFHTRLMKADGPKIPAVPHVACRTFASVGEVERLLERQSAFGDGPLEGLYLRLDEQTTPGAQETYLVDRCKLVRAEFRQAVDEGGRWEGRGKNQVDFASGSDYALRSYVLATGSSAQAEAPAEKYPSTPHLPFSPGVNPDDTQALDCAHLLAREVVVTEKLDGGNCCIKNGLVYARTHAQPASHQSFSAVKDLVKSWIGLPADLHIFGENMAAVHSIAYGNLTSFFYIFAARQGKRWLSWDEVVEVARDLDVPTVPVVFRGQFQTTEQLRAHLETWARSHSELCAVGTPEGFVVRRAEGFQESAFAESMAKYVRANHVQTDGSWRKAWKKHSLGDPLPERPLRQIGDHAGGSSGSTLRKGPLANPRTKHTIETSGGDVELPRNFSFLLEELAVSSTPKRKEQIIAMQTLGIVLVVTLTQEEPLPPNWFADTAVENMFVPVPNFEPPSLGQVSEIIDKIKSVVSAGGKIMVHCGGGKGRAGSVAACIILRYGLDSIAQAIQRAPSEGVFHLQSDDVIRYLRDQRPGSIETRQQESFVRQYASALWQERAHDAAVQQPVLNRSLSSVGETAARERAEQEEEALLEAELFESASSSTGLEQDARGLSFTPHPRSSGGHKAQRRKKELERMKRNATRRTPKFLVMCGLAGAGKSTFCRSLEGSGGWVRVNQDDLKRKGCEELLARTVPLVQQGRTKVVVDRCNITRRDRGEMLDLLHKPSARDVACIFFDFSAADCKVRAAGRENHPTIRKGGGARIIDDQAKRLEHPDSSEGFGSIEVVRSFADADVLLRRYGVSLPDEIAAGSAQDEEQPEIVEDAEDPEPGLEDAPRLPEHFVGWLRASLEDEQSGMDLETMLACVTVILENVHNDPDAIANAKEVLRDIGAPATAEALALEWQASQGM